MTTCQRALDEMTAEVEEVGALVEQRNAEVAKLLRLLTECEWDAEENCPLCRGWKCHEADCELAAAIESPTLKVVQP